MSEAPAWLAAFQAEFGAVLRTPLDRSQGILRSELPASWTRLGIRPRSQRSADKGLSDYHRQYWFRLLTVLQKDFPVTAHLLGLWNFNALAQNYLLAFPPCGFDLGGVRQNFVNFLRAEKAAERLLQAATLDQMRAEVFSAPASSSWSWANAATQDPARLQLKAAADWQIFREDWALVDASVRLEKNAEATPALDPLPHDQTQAWLIHRDDRGLMHRTLPEAQARLYERLARMPLADALMTLDAELQGSGDVQNHVQSWMALSVTWGLWTAG